LRRLRLWQDGDSEALQLDEEGPSENSSVDISQLFNSVPFSISYSNLKPDLFVHARILKKVFRYANGFG
jgi:hypothetical protein